MRSILSVLIIATFSFLQANAGDYPVTAINTSLLKKANAVIRLYDVRFTVNSAKETVCREHLVVTVLNEKGEDWAGLSEYYTRHRHIESIEGNLYDAFGKQLKKVKKKDIQDMSGNDGSSLMDDIRYKRHNFYYKGYPYTVEYIVEIQNKSTLFFPAWTPQPGEGVALEEGNFHVEYPADYQLRYKAFNYKGDPESKIEKSEKRLSWTVRNLPAVWREPFSPLWHELTTQVILGPGDFQMDDYKGNMASWQDFGKFVYSLKQGRDQLPPQIKQAVHQVADPLTDNREKAQRLYEYMQKNTRYISIQLGIGGWQPFEAKEVAAKGYGDCKALTNYMYSILKEAGIPSYYTIINAGTNNRYLHTDFPSQQFNHVILCVPMQKDSLWLECTSQTEYAGYLGKFTGDRQALLIDEKGGTLVRTPRYGMYDNKQVRRIKAVLDEKGALTVDARSTYSGLQQDDLHGLVNYLSREKLKEYLHEQLDFATYDINKFAYKPENNGLPALDEQLDITVSNYATVTGKRIFLVPNIMTRSGRKLARDSIRKTDIQLDFEYQDLDSVEIELPAGYTAESIPPPASLQSRFGKYSSTMSLSGNRIIYTRSIECASGRFPAATYEELVKFYEGIYKADRAKLVLVRN